MADSISLIPMAMATTMSIERVDWHGASINVDTVIDEGYRNTQNVRRFFKSEVGDDFSFDRSFMAWMKSNTGKSLGDAVQEFKRRKNQQ